MSDDNSEASQSALNSARRGCRNASKQEDGEMEIREEEKTVDKYCASIRRVHRIAPLFGRRKEEQKPIAIKERKNKTKSPIRFPFRPIPGRNFDGFIDRFVKRN